MSWQQIRQAMEQQFSTKEKPFEYPLRTYYHDLEAIQLEDKLWLQKEMADNYLSIYRQTIETLQEQHRKLRVIGDEAPRPYDRILAIREIKDIEILLTELMLNGPLVLEYDRRLKEMLLAKAKQIIEVPKGLPTPIEEAPEDKEPSDVRGE